MRNLFLILSIFCASIILLGGCTTAEDEPRTVLGDANPNYKAKYVLTVHSIINYPRASEIEKEITTFDGKRLWINTNQFLHSTNIEKAVAVPRPGEPDFYDIKLKLDHRGRLQWVQLSVNFRGEEMALLADGIFLRRFVPQLIIDENEEWITIEGPFDKITAKGIEKFTERNYRYYHVSPGDMFK